MKMLPLLLGLLFFFGIPSLNAQQSPKVLIIGIDGCKPDALQVAATPNIDQLITNATYSYESLTEAQTWSGVGWSGMLTGVWKAKHGVSDNSFNGSNFANYPHFFNHLDACDPDLVTASIVNWNPINTQIVDLVDYELNVGTDLAVRQEAINYLENNDPDVLFLHFDNVDHAGHSYGFSPTISQYTEVIEEADTHVGAVVAAVENRANYANENWIIIVSTDHGGTNAGHGGSSIDERQIFTIFSGNAIPNVQRSVSSSNTNMNNVLSLNGSDQFVDIPADSRYDFGSSQDFTIECRVRVNSVSGDPVIVANKDWASGLNAGYVFSFPANSSAWKVNIGDGNNRVDINGGLVNDGKWHHLAVSFDRNGQMIVYQDGSLIKTEDISGIGNIDAGLPFTIGQDGTHNYGDWFDGEIAEVRLWGSVITEQMLSAFACSALSNAHPNYGDLLGYWPIVDGNGTAVLDQSPHQNDGTVQGTTPNWLANAGDLTCLDYSGSLRIVDIPATALEFLCGSIDPSWELEGQSVPIINNPLPIALSHFSSISKDCSVLLDWTTASEINNKEIVLERSADGQQFKPLAKFTGSGDRNSSKMYQYEDLAPLAVNYYRLKQVDFGGQINYSELITARTDCSDQTVKLQLFPNPTEDNITLRFQSSSTQLFHLNLYDVYGKVVRKLQQESSKGWNEQVIELGDLPVGLYYIQLSEGHTLVATQKVVKR